jgi:long-chain fatty acid transport protein
MGNDLIDCSKVLLRLVVFFVSLVLLLGSALNAPIYAQGGGVANYEVSTPNVGEAYAGHAAIAADASTSFLNPAGMTRLNGRNILMGGEIAFLSSGFIPDIRNTVSGTGGHRIGGPIFLPGAYYVRNLGDRLRFGFNFNSPYGIKVDYDETWVGRYMTSYVSFNTLEARPSLAYRVNKWLSLGFGVSIQRAAFKHRNMVANLLDVGFTDGRVDVDFHAWSYGTNYGALLEPSKRTRIGMTYRSQSGFSLEGSVKAENLGPKLAALLASTPKSESRFYLPRGANISLYHEATGKLALLADGGWTNWSVFGRPQSWRAVTGSTSDPAHRWKDTWRIGLGMRYQLSTRVMLQAGSSYDSSPVSYWERGPDAPIDREWRYATGVLYSLKPGVTLGLSFVYKDLGPARIESSDSPGTGRVSGVHYNSRVPFIAFTMAFGPPTG